MTLIIKNVLSVPIKDILFLSSLVLLLNLRLTRLNAPTLNTKSKWLEICNRVKHEPIKLGHVVDAAIREVQVPIVGVISLRG